MFYGMSESNQRELNWFDDMFFVSTHVVLLCGKVCALSQDLLL